VISIFCRGVNEVFALLRCYEVFIGSYRRFGAYSIHCVTLQDGTDRLPETSVTTNQRWITSQKSEDIKSLVFSLLESIVNMVLSVVLYMFTKYGVGDVFLRGELLGMDLSASNTRSSRHLVVLFTERCRS
jgi:hypothetical protein